jgi:DNA-binding Lrp family transcriptional regulator
MTQPVMTSADTIQHPATQSLTELEKRLLNDYQRNFPLTSTPYADIAEQLGVSEQLVLTTLRRLKERGVISRLGPVFKPKRVGASTLAAMAVPEERLNEVARIVNRYNEVNHNYEREHEFNLWFVVTASDKQRISEVLDEIRQATGLQILDLPMEQSYHIDLGFPLWC